MRQRDGRHLRLRGVALDIHLLRAWSAPSYRQPLARCALRAACGAVSGAFQGSSSLLARESCANDTGGYTTRAPGAIMMVSYWTGVLVGVSLSGAPRVDGEDEDTGLAGFGVGVSHPGYWPPALGRPGSTPSVRPSPVWAPPRLTATRTFVRRAGRCDARAIRRYARGLTSTR